MIVTRKLDELGRIVLPMEFRNQLNISEQDMVDVLLEENQIVIQKNQPTCIFCGKTSHLTEYRGKFICHSCHEAVGK